MVFLNTMLLNHIFKVLFTAIFLITSVFGSGAYAETLPVGAENNLLLPSEASNLPALRGIKINPSNPFNFDFIVDNDKDALNYRGFKDQVQQAIGYFLAGLAIPQKDLWVNLSPYEQNRIAPDNLSHTALGNEFLNQDYLLKKLAASLTYPETEAGKKYWYEINSTPLAALGGSSTTALQGRPLGATSHGALRAGAQSSFTKVWIVPDQIKVFEDNDKAFIASCRLKVLTEQDYNFSQGSGVLKSNDNVTAFRTHILPLIEKEVNEGKNFASLRQAINSLVLAIWFKGKLKDAVLNKVYADKALTKGIEINDPAAKQKIYEQYLKVFEKGVYDYIKRGWTGTGTGSPARGSVYVPGAGKITTRRYFSGGVDVTRFAVAAQPWSNDLVRSAAKGSDLIVANVDIAPWGIYQRVRSERTIRLDTAQDEATRRYTDGHESFHALVDELRIAGINMRWLSVKREEKLAEIFGIAFRDGHQTISEHLLDDLKLVQDKINKLLYWQGKPTIDDLLEYLQDQDKYDHRNPQTLKQILNGIGIEVDVQASSAQELLKIHKSKKGIIRAEESVSQEESYPTSADLLLFRSKGKKYRVHSLIPRIEDFGKNKPIVVSRAGVRGVFTPFDDAGDTLREALAEFMDSDDIRREIDGVVFFKIVLIGKVLPAFMNTEENIIRVAAQFKLKRADPKLFIMLKVLPKYKLKKQVAISGSGLEGIFKDPEGAAKIINESLKEFMASDVRLCPVKGITFYKVIRNTEPIAVFDRTEENIALVAKNFHLVLDKPGYLEYIRKLPEFKKELCVAVSGPGFKGVYRNHDAAAYRLNKRLKKFMASPKKSCVINGIEFFKMRNPNNNKVVAAFKRSDENIALVAERFSFTLVDKNKLPKLLRAQLPKGLSDFDITLHVPVSNPGFKGLFKDRVVAAEKVNRSLRKFMASTDTERVVRGVKFVKVIRNNRAVVVFFRTTANIALMAKNYKLTPHENIVDLVRLEFIKRFAIRKKREQRQAEKEKPPEDIHMPPATDDVLLSDELDDESAGQEEVYRAAMPPNDEVGGIDVSENVVNIQTSGKFDTDSIDVNNIMADWKNIQGVAFNIISMKKITTQELFAAP
jgi:hypothetical protein